MKNKLYSNDLRIYNPKALIVKSESAITLVALIITVIILVILAAISIKAVYDSDIIGFTTNGAVNYSEQATKELDEMNKTVSVMQNTIDKITIALSGGNNDGGDGNGGNDTNNPIDFGSLSDTEKEGYIGQYVAYTPTAGTFSDHVGATYSGSSSNTAQLSTDTSLNWRILFVDSTKVTLISDTSAHSGFYLQSYQGYNNGVLLLNNACKAMYSNTTLGATGRSMKIEDIESVSSYDKTTYTNESYSYGTEYTPSDKYYPSIFAQEKTGYVNTAYGTSLGLSEQSSYITQSSSLQATTLKGKYTYYNYAMSTTYIQEPYLEMFRYKPGTTTNHTAYWLASRCVSYSNINSFFYLFFVDGGNVRTYILYYSYVYTKNPSYAVRPVVEINLASVSIGATGSGTSADPYSITAK